jgi:hypothetical protein
MDGGVRSPSEPHRYPRSRRRQGTWWAPRSSKSVGGRKLAGGFDSRPPPLPKAPSDQRRSAEPGERRPREAPDLSSNDRVHHTSLSLFPPPGAGQVFRPPAGGPDKSSFAVFSKASDQS